MLGAGVCVFAHVWEWDFGMSSLGLGFIKRL